MKGCGRDGVPRAAWVAERRRCDEVILDGGEDTKVVSMRILWSVSGIVELLARFLSAQRRLQEGGLESESVQIVRGGRRSEGVSMQWSSTRSQVSSNRGEVEAVIAMLAEQRDRGASVEEFEVLLPQTVALLLEFAPQSQTQPTAAELLTVRLGDALVRACSKSSQLGLESCWLLQDLTASDSKSDDGLLLAASPRSPYERWSAKLMRDCWRSAARPGTRDTAILVSSMVQISEKLAKIDRNKRRDRSRLMPLLEAANKWLQARPQGVRLPLLSLDTGHQLRLLRLDATSSVVMPSRARAPTLIFCEALDIPDDDQEPTAPRHHHPMNYKSLSPSSSSSSSSLSPWRSTTENSQRRRRTTTPVLLAEMPPPSERKTTHKRLTRQRPVLFPETASPLLRHVYSPCWLERENLLRQTSPYAHLPGWRLASFLVKADDELRREILAMQAVKILEEICDEEDVGAWFHPYATICAGKRAGILETLPDSKSLDFVKKEFLRYCRAPADSSSASLGRYFDAAYPLPEDRRTAAVNFAVSLASYSLLCYVFDVKDRHNGNILLDAAGRLVHIDFGYVLGASPGSINFEDAPFKLTPEYLDVLQQSPVAQSVAFTAFVNTFTKGLHAIYKHRSKLQALLALYFTGHPQKRQHAVQHNFLLKFNDLDGHPATTAAVARGLIREALNSERTRQYDWYQWKTNGYII